MKTKPFDFAAVEIETAPPPRERAPDAVGALLLRTLPNQAFRVPNSEIRAVRTAAAALKIQIDCVPITEGKTRVYVLTSRGLNYTWLLDLFAARVGHAKRKHGCD